MPSGALIFNHGAFASMHLRPSDCVYLLPRYVYIYVFASAAPLPNLQREYESNVVQINHLMINQCFLHTHTNGSLETLCIIAKHRATMS